MRNMMRYRRLLPVYMVILLVFITVGMLADRAVTTLSRSRSESDRICIVIDPGHGGEDGGATSCTGVLESKINLDISLRLNDLLHLLGFDTCMIRSTDRSVYTQGKTLSQKKISDLKERVRVVNETPNAVLISIHQNQFVDSKYSGAQVFYAQSECSDQLAGKLQSAFVEHLNPGSNRKSKIAKGVYLMEHIRTTGVLIECGFLSNPQEEALLNDPSYQKKICAVIGSVCSTYLPNICLEKS